MPAWFGALVVGALASCQIASPCSERSGCAEGTTCREGLCVLPSDAGVGGAAGGAGGAAGGAGGAGGVGGAAGGVGGTAGGAGGTAGGAGGTAGGVGGTAGGVGGTAGGACSALDGGLLEPGWFAVDNVLGQYDSGESYVLLRHLLEFHATRDLRWLTDFVRHADQLLANRDDRRARFFRQPVWSTFSLVRPCCSSVAGGACEALQPVDLLPDGGPPRYGTGEPLGMRCRWLPVATTLSTGLITTPLVEFAQLVRETGALGATRLCDGRTLADVADQYVRAAEESVAAHDFEWYPALGTWRPAPHTRFVFVDSAGRPVADFADQPYNMSHALGRTVVLLEALTGRRRYAAQASALAATFRAHLGVQGDGAYTWLYWQSDALLPYLEDVTHGHLSVDFARLAFARRLGFTLVDLQRFAATVALRLAPASGGFAGRVDGSWIDPAHAFSVPFWASLGPYRAPDVTQAVARALAQGAPGTAELRRYGQALAAEYGGTGTRAASTPCTQDRQCASHVCFAGVVCGDLLGDGSGCTRDAECASQRCASTDAGRACLPAAPFTPPTLRPVGLACTGDEDCSSYLCGDGGVCALRRTAPAPCARSNDCTTGLCVSGACAEFR